MNNETLIDLLLDGVTDEEVLRDALRRQEQMNADGSELESKKEEEENAAFNC